MADSRHSYSCSVGDAWVLLLISLWVGFVVHLPFLLLGKLLPPQGWGQSALALVAYTLSFGGALWVARSRGRSEEGRPPVLKVERVPAGILAVVCLMAAMLGVLVEPITALIPGQDWFAERMGGAARPDVFSFMMIVVAAPLLEEALFRGFILEGLLKRHSPGKALFWSSFFFAVMHLNPWQGVAAFFSGLFLGWVYWKTRSLLPCFGMHATINLLSFLWVTYGDARASLVGSVEVGGAVAVLLGAALLFTLGCWWLAKKLRRPALAPVPSAP